MQRLVFLGIVASLAASAAFALEPDQLLLITNRNIPESRKLAEFYSNARKVPAGRILSLSVPTVDEISFAAYERDVVPVVRKFLRDNGLEQKVTCVVTFFGVPLRIGNRLLSAQDKDELIALEAQRDLLAERVRMTIRSLEQKAAEVDPSFSPVAGEKVEHLVQRAEAVFVPLSKQANQGSDARERSERIAAMMDAVRQLGGPSGIVRMFTTAENTSSEEEKRKFAELAVQVQKAATAIAQLQEQRNDPQARQRLRQIVGEAFGSVELLRVLQAQAEFLNPASSAAALDSELSLLWWNLYPRTSWQPNLLGYHVKSGTNARTLMVMRLDAPRPGQVTEIVLTSLKAERDGLKGKLVLDSRNLSARGEEGKVGQYGWYDQTIRNLADLVRTKTRLGLLFDDSPQVLAAGSAQDVALYCGWYSLRNYVPCCRFNPGAVGFHVASLELVSLRADGETGWVRGMLNDGVSGTIGAVAEPYLVAFPTADDFFPLLLTGRLTLAEVYWRTLPVTSWNLAAIGDPLYTPYKQNPALRVEDLPERLKVIFEPPEGAAGR